MLTASSCMARSMAILIALDGQTGKEVWVVKLAYPEHGETITPAPLIADDKVIEGFGGDEFAARGRMTAYNLKDGSLAWVCQSTGSDKDVCLTENTNKAHPRVRHGWQGSRHQAPSRVRTTRSAAARLGVGTATIPT